MMAAAPEMPHTRLIDVCDREADFFELFEEQRHNPIVNLLIRANYSRKVIEEPFKLIESVRMTPVKSRVRIPIQRQSARPKRSKKEARRKRPSRLADMAVRYMCVQLSLPSYFAGKSPIDIRVIHALEDHPTAKAEPVEWFLLTTVDIGSLEVAERRLSWYCLRWRIEDWHRVLKSGLRH